MITPKSPELIINEFRNPLHEVVHEQITKIDIDEEWLRQSLASVVAYAAEETYPGDYELCQCACESPGIREDYRERLLALAERIEKGL